MISDKIGCVYKIYREDGLCYIGVTTNLSTRLFNHSRNEKFLEKKIDGCEILFEGPYSECLDIESHFIEMHDTFRNGLNKTHNGKGRKDRFGKFNMIGFKFSEESRRKMSESGKERAKRFPRKGKHLSEKQREISKQRIVAYNALGLPKAPITTEGRRKLSESAKGRKPRLGFKNSEKQNHLISESAKNRPRLCCISCKKEMVTSAWYNHLKLFDKGH